MNVTACRHVYHWVLGEYHKPPQCLRCGADAPLKAVAADAAMLDAELGPTCPKVGRVGTQRHHCRFPAGHSGACYWYLMGAVEER